jgi:Leucine-rich repeat (LRR) protein
LILQELPLWQRLWWGALVCTSWADAAIAATVDPTSKQLELTSSRHAKAYHSWCVKHQAYVKIIFYGDMRVMGSPVDHNHLQVLSINTSYTVRLAPSSGQWRGLLPNPTALTSLQLINTSVYGWREAALQLTGLQSLHITDVKVKDTPEPHIPGQHLGLLQQLTYLGLKGEGAVTTVALQQLSSLPQLKELTLASALWADGKEDGLELAAVNSSIRHLQCLTNLFLFELVPVPRGISKLAALEELKTSLCPGVQSECFGGGTNLKSLTFQSSPVTGEEAQGQLLQHLGRMKHLTHLGIHSSLTDCWGGVPLLAFGGITASSSLQHLSLNSCSLPEGAWRSIFRQGHDQQLTALTDLSLQFSAPKLATNDIKRMVRACPNLRTLDAWYAVQPRASLLALTKLTALTLLHVSQVTTESAVRTLAQLSGLRELRVRQPSEVSRVSRLHLTALKQLRQLVLPACRSDNAPVDCYAEDWEESFCNSNQVSTHALLVLLHWLWCPAQRHCLLSECTKQTPACRSSRLQIVQLCGCTGRLCQCSVDSCVQHCFQPR